MNLDETQRKQVAAWIAEGLKISEIQNQIASQMGVRMTYMEVRLLVDDLKLTPKDIELVKTPTSPLQTPTPKPVVESAQSAKSVVPTRPAQSAPAVASSGVSVSVDQITRPGAVISGKVTFGDGNRADWYLDEMGRLGLAPQQTGYRPPPAELQQFQAALEDELRKLGL
jgi:hypothetical protein